MHKRILVPVDLDNVDKLENALELAATAAKHSGATLVYVNIVDAVPTSSARTEGERMEKRLKKFADDQAETHGIRTVDQVTLRGDLQVNAGADIIRTAKQTECDLIIMASHVPGLKEHFIASNAGYVATHAPMSVYVAR